ncbi:hypothetical protein [Streptomyces sp. NRRL S-920]|uniref:hypothetical protein n=1 Tax=Streptomyces sp. NRRL S-920 TaxID=1463921 RepID=UPI0006898EFF|nr:hypothetical protein [Streptomyces sp. NRRL S-920]
MAHRLLDPERRGFAFTTAGTAARLDGELPPWFKWQMVRTAVADKLDAWRLRVTYAAEDAWNAVRRRRS